MDGEAIVWFRRDLRLDDNPAWAAATRRHRQVVPLFVVDERLLRPASALRRAYLLGHLRALDDRLGDLGGRLLVTGGDPTVVVPTVADGRPVYVNRDYSPFAVRRDAGVRCAVSHLVEHDGSLVHQPGSVLTGGGRMYRVFTPFHRAWAELPVPPEAVPGRAAVAGDVGEGIPAGPVAADTGERAAARRVAAAVRGAARYAGTRDRLDLDATSRLSQHLKFGSVSPATVVRSFRGAAGAAAFVRQLAWRDFHAHMLWFEPHAVTMALRPEMRSIRWVHDVARFSAWRDGATGYPLVDAAMRQLRAEGWMPNRARLVAASFLVKDLGIDWRLGERHFRHHLVDGDIAQNVGNWQWVAGTGRDAAPYFRVFNPVTQSRRFDPSGGYIRHWIPELRAVAGPAIHDPWEHPGALDAAGVVLGVDYPEPLVDHAEARSEALQRYRPG